MRNHVLVSDLIPYQTHTQQPHVAAMPIDIAWLPPVERQNSTMAEAAV